MKVADKYVKCEPMTVCHPPCDMKHVAFSPSIRGKKKKKLLNNQPSYTKKKNESGRFKNKIKKKAKIKRRYKGEAKQEKYLKKSVRAV